MVFRVSPDGNVSVDEIEGFGSACLDATKLLEQALGKADESTRKLTEEYEQLPPAAVRAYRAMKSVIFVDNNGDLIGLADNIIDKINNLGWKQVTRVSDVEFNHKEQLWEARDLKGEIIASGSVRSDVIDKEREYFNRKIKEGFEG